MAQRTLEVRYAGVSFLDDGQVTYQARLVPDETDWRETRTTEARYIDLGPGRHVFEVRARHEAGHFGQPTRYAFNIVPAWWQTWWARLAGAALLLGLLGLVASWRVRALGSRKAQEALVRSAASFRKLIEASPDGIFVHRDGVLVFVNPAAVASLGFTTTAELVGLPLGTLFPPQDREQAGLRLRPPPGDEPTPMREERMLRRDGSSRTFEIAALRAEFDGQPCILAFARDVSERKQLEARLLISDRMASVGTLASGVAHEINNPLAYVRSNLDWGIELLQAAPQGLDAGNTRALEAALADAADGAERVRKIIGGLRSFARVQDDQGVDTALPEVLEAALKLVANQVRHRACVVRDYAPAPLVHADPSRLAQVFVNLIVNAAQAIPEGRALEHVVRVSTRTDERGRSVAEVHDSGCGIPPEVIGRIFDPFFTTKEVGSGTGLGLSICHGIITNLGGEITVASRPGAGTTFTVVLPAVGAPVDVSAELERAPA